MADQIAAEVVSAQADAESYRRQVEVVRDSVASAGASYESNWERIKQIEGRPIELLQAIHARSTALDHYKGITR